MVGYLFYPPADTAQDRIWRDTVERWGESQAEAYVLGLHRHLQKLSITPALWRVLPRSLAVPETLDVDVWFNRYEHHYIFFRKLFDGRIGIISLLHERMDLPVRLTDDLLNITRQNPT
ncbi:type II toxin-antitoxin system RelE/ParE family toxin [Rhizobium panacihumi]|uniref:type II toxin-antitoxin system RelE/ParE family toxin n=1 Tax=Rhizobium panacihumi TaxID=2008450 RepID=UPI003D7AC71B